MSKLRLVDRQGMETLPSKGFVYVVYGITNPVVNPDHRFIDVMKVEHIRSRCDLGYTFDAWSYSATCAPETNEGEGESNA